MLHGFFDTCNTPHTAKGIETNLVPHFHLVNFVGSPGIGSTVQHQAAHLPEGSLACLSAAHSAVWRGKIWLSSLLQHPSEKRGQQKSLLCTCIPVEIRINCSWNVRCFNCQMRMPDKSQLDSTKYTLVNKAHFRSNILKLIPYGSSFEIGLFAY